MTTIVFMGTPEFAVPILEALVNAPQYEIQAVLTQPDRPVGRKHRLTESPVKIFAKDHGLMILQPQKLSGSPEMQTVIDLNPDLMITAAYGQFLPTKMLAAAKIAAINVHGSLLPKYRGGAPIQYSVMNGDKETGVTIMHMVKKMDAGNIIAQATEPITKDDDSGTMFKKLSLVGRDLLMKTLPQIIDGTAPSIKQDESKVVFSPNIKPEEERIDYQLPANRIDDLVRGLRPDPVGNMIVDNQRTKIFDVTPLKESTSLEPGKVVRVDKHTLVISAGEGTTYQINRLQPAGKSVMDITAYLNGHQNLQPGVTAITDD